jgi:hypothetical protein
MVDSHYPYVWPVGMGRTYGCQKACLAKLFFYSPFIRAVHTGSVAGDPYVQPIRMGPRPHYPYVRAVRTART